MQERLSPMNTEAVDPRLAPHLEPGETVLWQNQPGSGSFFGPVQILWSATLIGLGIVIASGMVGPELLAKARYASAATAAGVGLLLLFTSWQRRAALWSYAVTDRRLLSVLGNKVIRSVTPDQLDRFELRIKGDTVYWQKLLSRERDTVSGQARAPDGHLVGFHGQADPRATKSMIESWRQGISDRAAAAASAFVKTMSAAPGNREESASASPPAGVVRVHHTGTGLHLDVLPDWKVIVRTRYDGPLKLFGLTLLPRIIRDGPERPYGDGSGWNTLSVRGAPEAGLDLTIFDRPLETTLDAIVNDPFMRLTGTEILHTTPDLRIGPFAGFSVVRKMPPALEVKNVPSLSAPAMFRQVWLGHEGASLEVTGYALDSQTDVQDAIDAMIRSITVQGQPMPAQ